MAQLVHDLISNAAWKTPQQPALCAASGTLDYQALAAGVDNAAQALLSLGLERGERVAVLLDKRSEALLAMMGALAAGGAMVVLDPVLSAEQVGQALRDSGACMLLTTRGRHATLGLNQARCPGLRCVLETGSGALPVPGMAVFGWNDVLGLDAGMALPRAADDALAALLYSWPGGDRPRRCALTHRQLIDIAREIGGRLGQRAQLRSLLLLPFGERAAVGLLASCLAAAGAVLLVNQLQASALPALVEHQAASLVAAPPWLWMQAGTLDWPCGHALRAAISCAGTLPGPTLAALQRRLPLSAFFLMPERGGPHGAALVSHPGAAPGVLMPG